MSEFNEPWESLVNPDEVGHHIVDAAGREVADDGSAGGEYPQTMTKETAERIVACVNFCRDVPTAILNAAAENSLDAAHLLTLIERMKSAADQPAATSAG